MIQNKQKNTIVLQSLAALSLNMRPPCTTRVYLPSQQKTSTQHPDKHTFNANTIHLNATQNMSVIIFVVYGLEQGWLDEVSLGSPVHCTGDRVGWIGRVGEVWRRVS